MRKRNLILILFCTGLCNCGQKKAAIDNTTKEFKVESLMSKFDLKFRLPKNFISVRDIDVDHLTDTTNLLLNRILNAQYENGEAFWFYDSADVSFNIFIKAGPRVDISKKERKLTYFTVPAVPLYKVFPAESEDRKIIFDSGEKKYKEKTYYKRRYQLKPDSLGFQDAYYITTKWQSVLIVVNSLKVNEMDKYLLNYELIAKAENSN